MVFSVERLGKVNRIVLDKSLLELPKEEGGDNSETIKFLLSKTKTFLYRSQITQNRSEGLVV